MKAVTKEIKAVIKLNEIYEKNFNKTHTLSITTVNGKLIAFSIEKI